MVILVPTMKIAGEKEVVIKHYEQKGASELVWILRIQHVLFLSQMLV